MFISSIHVRHFRCIVDATLDCEPLTALVGPNGCGKSTLLKAVELFFSSEARVLDEDFYNRDTSSDIEITLTFRDVDPIHSELLGPYLQGSSLEATRVFSYTQGRFSAKFYGYMDRHSGFTMIRDVSSATQQKDLYENLRADHTYGDLPRWTKQGDLANFLKHWEDNHAEHCERLPDDGSVFGVGTVAKFDIGKLVHVVFIPAVRDAVADATDMRGSPITELLDIAFRSGMSDREDFRALQADVEARYGEILDDARQSQFRQVEENLSRAMSAFVSSVEIKFDWREREKVKIPPPSAEVLIVQDGYESPVDRTGHGIQRAFTLSLLQEIAAARLGLRQSTLQEPAGPQVPLPVLLLIIEEPELFQHPNRQRSIARTLQELSSGSIPGVAERTQVIFGTHNPLFVSIKCVEQVRVLRKAHFCNGSPKATTVKRFDPQVFLNELTASKDQDDSVQEWSFHHMKLNSIMTPIVNEGFFAKGVILVEGDIDRSGIMAACALQQLNLEDVGISVIQCRGKANLVRLSLIFRQLDIEVFVVWDRDAEKNGDASERARRVGENRQLHRLVGISPMDPTVTRIMDTFACFETDLEKQVRCDLGDFYEHFMADSREYYGIKRGEAIKHPHVFEELLLAAAEGGHSAVTLAAIVEKIKAMAERIVAS